MTIPAKVIKRAHTAALKSTHKFKVGAVVYIKNRILGYGWNKADKTHPRSLHPYSTIHAELDALIGLRRVDLAKASIYVHRVRRDGLLGCAAPCKYCRAMLVGVGIRDIAYSD